MRALLFFLNIFIGRIVDSIENRVYIVSGVLISEKIRGGIIGLGVFGFFWSFRRLRLDWLGWERRFFRIFYV